MNFWKTFVRLQESRLRESLQQDSPANPKTVSYAWISPDAELLKCSDYVEPGWEASHVYSAFNILREKLPNEFKEYDEKDRKGQETRQPIGLLQLNGFIRMSNTYSYESMKLADFPRQKLNKISALILGMFPDNLPPNAKFTWWDQSLPNDGILYKTFDNFLDFLNDPKSFKPSNLHENSEYRGEHSAPDRETGSPLFDVTLNGTYPVDFYSNMGARYYGDNGGDSQDRESVAIVQNLRNRPNRTVKIYRAVPKIETNAEQIATLQKYADQWLARRKPNPLAMSYDNLLTTIERLQKLPEVEVAKIAINPGDWVSINRQYCVDHGKSALRGKFRILSKTVKASEVFTNGDSVHEQGYCPG